MLHYYVLVSPLSKNVRRQLSKLRIYLLRRRRPDDPDIDWRKVYEFWLKHHGGVPDATKLKRPTEREPFNNRSKTMNYRAKKRGILGAVTPSDLVELMEKFGYKCARCPETKHLVFDHIRPFYRGGDNSKDNLQVLCRLCNMEKGVSGS